MLPWSKDGMYDIVLIILSRCSIGIAGLLTVRRAV